jgi:hypothetical protein
MATQILLEDFVFQTTKCVAGFVTISSNDDDLDYEQFDFIIEATMDVTTEEETYIVKWSDKKPKKRKSIEDDIVMNYKLSNY